MKSIKLFALLALPLSAAGCSPDGGSEQRLPGDRNDGGSDRIVFNISFAPTSRVSAAEAAGGGPTRVATDEAFNTTWQEGDVIGIRAYDALGFEPFFDNMPLTYSNGEWVGDDIYWPGDAVGSLTFQAFYPYDMESALQADQSTEENHNRSNSLFAQAGCRKGETVNLEFHHERSLVQVDITDREPGAVYNDGLSVTLKNVRIDGGSNELKDVKMYRVPGAERVIFRALILPQTLMPGDLFVIAQDGWALTHTNPAEVRLDEGTVKKWNIIVGWGVDPDHQYAVGDPYPHAGPVSGVVFEVSDEGRHGKILALDQTGGMPWSGEAVVTGANDLNDGAANMATVYAFNGGGFGNYPAFERCHGRNPAGTTYSAGQKGVWYLPAINELQTLCDVWLADPDRFREKLADAGGQAMDTRYWSSTEIDESYAESIKISTDSTINKYGNNRVRAVMAF
ncbi:MAG: fimbrillin family protein [Alistipes sp.]|jgi:hypothetical protein|nr:fimbrillin family protein [Alistipes sp.]